MFVNKKICLIYKNKRILNNILNYIMQMLMQNQRSNPLNQVLESFKNINNALNIAQSKGVFTLQQSSIIYKALQDVNEYFEKTQQHMKSSQTITRMTKEEAEDSAAQEEKGIVLNEAEQKKLRRINEIENQIAQAVETSSESSIEENQEEYENVDEVVEEDEVEEDVVEEEVEDEVEEEVEDVVEEEVEDVVKEVEPNTLPSNYFTKQYQKQRRERLNEENRISNIFYSDSDDDETIEI